LSQPLIVIARAQKVNEVLHFRYPLGRKPFDLLDNRLLVLLVHGRASSVAMLPVLDLPLPLLSGDDRQFGINGLTL
jgi:hypothetical protein